MRRDIFGIVGCSVYGEAFDGTRGFCWRKYQETGSLTPSFIQSRVDTIAGVRGADKELEKSVFFRQSAACMALDPD